jgi:hypothetical protein
MKVVLDPTKMRLIFESSVTVRIQDSNQLSTSLATGKMPYVAPYTIPSRLTFLGVDYRSRTWARCSTYGGIYECKFLPAKDLSHAGVIRHSLSTSATPTKPKHGTMGKGRSRGYTHGSGYFLQCTNATSPLMTSKMQVNKARASLLVQLSIWGGLSKSKTPMSK